MKTLTRIAVVVGLALGAPGCEDSPAPAPVAATPTPPSPPKPKAEPPAEVPAGPVFVYAYNPTGKRDPFRVPEDEIRPNINPLEQACSEPLCQYELEQLSLVGVVTGGPNPMAMVEDPLGRGFSLRRNSRVGKRGGKVTAIRRDEITITEYWTGPDGKVVPNMVDKKLSPEMQGVPVIDLVTGVSYP
jgi:type IV pilus assembly protein PilP